MLKKSQSRLIDLALNKNSTGNPPTPTILHGPAPGITVCHKKITEKRKKPQPPPVQTPGGTKLLQPKG
jgi:hypothetical protein